MNDFLNADFIKTIITESKKMRKGTAMIVFFVCICCACIDYILRKHGINEDWFTHSYILIAFSCISIWCIKLFNAICDNNDLKKSQKLKKEKETQKILTDYELLKPVFDSFKDNRIVILRDFVHKNVTKLTITQLLGNDVANNINSINSYIYSYGYHIENTNLCQFVIAEITPEFLELLKLYFSQKH